MANERNAHWAGNAERTTVTIKGDLFDTGWGFQAFVPEKEVSDTSDNLVRAELTETVEAVEELRECADSRGWTMTVEGTVRRW